MVSALKRTPEISTAEEVSSGEDVLPVGDRACDVFVSCDERDYARVAPIVTALRRTGLSVWWKRDLVDGASWRQEVSERLEKARCVVAIWSKRSVEFNADAVHEEADRGKKRGVLVSIRIDDVAPPLGFGQVKPVDLILTRGKIRGRRLVATVAAVEAKLKDRVPRLPVAQRRLHRITAAALGPLTLLVVLFGFAADLVGLQSFVCRVPGVRALCAERGLGGVATAAEDRLWAAREKGDCGGLRLYLERFPKGVYAEEADRLLSTVQVLIRERWEAQEQELPLVVRPTLRGLASLAEAREDARARAKSEATLICAGFDQTGLSRVVSTSFEVGQWRCSGRGGGSVCGFDGNVLCGFEIKERSDVRVCR